MSGVPISRGALAELPRISRLLTVVAHPDDESFGLEGQGGESS